ncbi:Lrp/AsnC family transcriptional regulator [Fodinibius halophilus]|uniref:Lrp/AsnC family transcriptional regulator n=1 Tax=Fodinibius halophilus TaxID=1736908 RepID=A0A6M1T3H7_9BACT|nr:Lrp/AsnC family transcriptional regulator [Fodinibius halophilus]NGP89986.1 Lrp/AsnC family transcriptional regulator [Fodinibius halophilus]
MSRYQLDDTDKKILSILQKDGRIPNNKLAEKVGLTTTPTLERVKRLEREGIIKGYGAQVDPEAIEKGLVVFCSLRLAVHKMHTLDEVCNEIDKMPEIQACYHITGDADFLLKIVVKDMPAYERFVHDKLTQLQGIERIYSNIVMSTKKENYHLPINEEHHEKQKV